MKVFFVGSVVSETFKFAEFSVDKGVWRPRDIGAEL